MLTSSTRSPLRITLLYTIFASLWILFSDTLLNLLVKDAERILQLSIFKGWFFIIFTGLMLYYLIQRHTLQYTMNNQELEKTNFELMAAYEELRALEEELQYQLTSLEKSQDLLQKNEESLIIKNNYLNALF